MQKMKNPSTDSTMHCNLNWAGGGGEGWARGRAVGRARGLHGQHGSIAAGKPAAAMGAEGVLQAVPSGLEKRAMRETCMTNLFRSVHAHRILLSRMGMPLQPGPHGSRRQLGCRTARPCTALERAGSDRTHRAQLIGCWTRLLAAWSPERCSFFCEVCATAHSIAMDRFRNFNSG